MCVCVCMCVRSRKRAGQRKREYFAFEYYTSDDKLFLSFVLYKQAPDIDQGFSLLHQQIIVQTLAIYSILNHYHHQHHNTMITNRLVMEVVCLQ